MSETNQELTQQYHARTQAAISELSESIRKGSHSQEDIEKAAFEISRLRKDYADAITFLASYDQRQYDNQLNILEVDVEQLRASALPKSKFAFKRKPGKATPSPSTQPQTPELPSLIQSIGTVSEPTGSGLSLSSQTNKYLTLSSLSSPCSSASDLTISDLDHCVVNLIASAANADASSELTFTALHARNLSNTVLILPIVVGSALLHDITNCVIALGSRQFRMHASSQVDVYITISSNPIIEHCSAIRFADYPAILRRSSSTGPGDTILKSNYLAAQDFSHIRATPSPNWSALPEDATPSEERWPLTPTEDVGDILQLLLPSYPPSHSP